MIVHLDSDLVPSDYEAYRILVPDHIEPVEVALKDLPEGWRHSATCRKCLLAGNAWLDLGQSAVLKVPTAVLPHGANFLLNPAHEDAASIRVLSKERFDFDPRLL